jgi:DNA-binding CsgD family transcriptional regulator
MRTPVARWHHIRNLASIDHARGDFERAHERALSALDLVRATGGPVVVQISVSLLATVASMTADEQPILEQYQEYLCQPPEIIAAMVGGWHAECGRLDIARRCYLPDQVNQPIAGMRYLSHLSGLIEMAAAFDDRETSAAAYRKLLPYGHLIVCGGAGIVSMHGAVHGSLGVAATTLGKLDDAVRHFREAIEINERSGMRPYTAIARLKLAQVLARRRRPGDENEAAALAVSTVALTGQLGMKLQLSEAQALSASLSGDSSGPLSKRELEIATLVAQGLTNKQIAASTHISVRTVETHVQHILAKLGFATRTQIATWAQTEMITDTR